MKNAIRGFVYLSRDSDRAEDFYTKAFDWTSKPVGIGPPEDGKTRSENGRFFHVKTDANDIIWARIAGHDLYQEGLEVELPHGPMLMIHVPNLEEANEKVTSAGGEVLKIVDLPWYRFSVARDPEGQGLVLWEPPAELPEEWQGWRDIFASE